MPIKISSVEYKEHIAEEKATYSELYQGQEAQQLLPNRRLMWAETKDVVASIWRTLPANYRLNHTGYAERKLMRNHGKPTPVSIAWSVSGPRVCCRLLIADWMAARSFVPQLPRAP